MGKGPKCETNPLPRGFNVARLLSRAVALKNMFCAFCVFPVGVGDQGRQATNTTANRHTRPITKRRASKRGF